MSPAKYYMDCPYTILWVTDRFINCNLARRVMNYLLYYTQYLQICQTAFFVCYCISKAKHEFGQNPKEIIMFTGHGQYTVILTGSLINTNRENMNVKNNIYIHIELGSVKRYKALGLCDSICNTLSVLSYHSLV